MRYNLIVNYYLLSSGEVGASSSPQGMGNATAANGVASSTAANNNNRAPYEPGFIAPIQVVNEVRIRIKILLVKIKL